MMYKLNNSYKYSFTDRTLSDSNSLLSHINKNLLGLPCKLTVISSGHWHFLSLLYPVLSLYHNFLSLFSYSRPCTSKALASSFVDLLFISSLDQESRIEIVHGKGIF